MIAKLDNVNLISQILSKGKIILCPTATIWGLSCDINSQEAVERIYLLKQRDRDKPFILLVDSIEMLKLYVKNMHPRVETLLQHYTNPLTIIHEANENIPSFLKNNSNTIAIRLTPYPLLSQVINVLGRPIVSTSANIQGEESPSGFNSINKTLIDSVDYVCQTDRHLNNDKASTIIKYSDEGE